MSFQVSKQDIKKSQRCPQGMNIFTLVTVDDAYTNAKGTMVQKADFESEDGYCVSFWFNDKMLGMIIEFVAAADDVDAMGIDAGDIELKDYLDKKVAAMIVHSKDDKGKLQASIENFFSTSKIPF